jgi:hypothetical protein
MFGMSFHDRQAIKANIERQTYKKIQDLCQKESRTLTFCQWDMQKCGGGVVDH